MKVNIPQTHSVVLICILAFGILQHAVSAADERQTLQALSKSFTVLAQEVGEVVVGIETERSDENRDRSFRFERRGRSEGWEQFSPEEFRRWFRQNSDRDEKSENYFFDPDPYRERQEQRRNVIPPDMFPNEIRHEINFGSGILLDEQGHIATVIELVNDSKEITITLQDGTRLDAEVVASDKGTGIVVLKVDTDELPTARFGDSDDVACPWTYRGSGTCNFLGND